MAAAVPLPFPCPAPSVVAIDRGGRYVRRCLLADGHDGPHKWSQWLPTEDEPVRMDEGEAAEAC